MHDSFGDAPRPARDIRFDLAAGALARDLHTHRAMLKKMCFAVLVVGTLGGCLVEHQSRPVRPSYVAQCPSGYRFDGHDCHRVEPAAAIVVEVR